MKHEYPKHEVDPLTGHDESDFYFLPSDERAMVLENPVAKGILRREREN